MKKFPYIIIALAMLLPLGASAASITFAPALGSYVTDQTFTTSVFVTPAAGESISATKVSLTFPADKLEIVSYTPINGGNILAHIGTSTDNTAGTIVDNVAFNPAITSSTKIATVIFKAKSAGNAQLAVAADSKLLDTTNTDKKTSSTPATYTVSVPVPEPVTTTEPDTPADNVVIPPSLPIATPAPAQDDTDTQEDGEQMQEDEAVEQDGTDEVVAQDDTTGQVAAAAGALDTVKSKWYYLLLLLLPFFIWFIWKKRKKKEDK